MVDGEEGNIKDFSRGNWVIPFMEMEKMKGGIWFLKRESKGWFWP